MSLPLHTFATMEGLPAGRLLKVLGHQEALESSIQREAIALDLRGIPANTADALPMSSNSFGVVFGDLCHRDAARAAGLPLLHSLRRTEVAGQGDVLRVEPRNGRVDVLYRRGANANSLFVTGRCNSRCLMCSQPPVDEDDSWRAPELAELIGLIDANLPALGVTGGEPTLLGIGLAAARKRLPTTRLHVLTNGRRFSEPRMLEVMEPLEGCVTWAIPLHADVAQVHDRIAQADGAFHETLEGIHNLAERRHAIEIRFVAHALSLPRLPGLAEFVWRNAPFAEHVALMGIEPMGYARRNYDSLWVDPAEAATRLAEGALYLAARGMAVSIYNVPLCLLPEAAWPFARQSISDWKREYGSECTDCGYRDSCSGFFISANAVWRRPLARPVATLVSDKAAT